MVVLFTYFSFCYKAAAFISYNRVDIFTYGPATLNIFASFYYFEKHFKTVQIADLQAQNVSM